jgi:protein-S-isoprenylcysteine O-methyltransferase Ste14
MAGRSDPPDESPRTRLPALGPRGEGWVVAQLVLFAAIAVFGLQAWLGRPAAEGPGIVQMVIGAAAVALGGVVAARGLWGLGRHVSPFPRPVTGAPLVDRGAYSLVRHPIYSGLVLAAAGWGLATGSLGALVCAALLFLLFDGKSRREEVWLAAVHPDYAAYRARTKRLIPWVY